MCRKRRLTHCAYSQLGCFALAGAAFVGKTRKVKKNLGQPSPLRRPDSMAVICEQCTPARQGVVLDREGDR